ncbi:MULTISPECIES: HNH endonuclease signature motif containing protein [Bacillus]|uniref:Toxin component n=2 Tax=Bacillus cereus group TaxID=86661 RepID=A0A9X0GCI5_BACCE|nr:MULTISPECIES: HNH endonuclease [Bacillus]AKE17624.1 putative toxin component near putative ESAT-related proteins, repetitive [Bacillus cereus]ASI84285.1 Putative toxin component near putative ESAT-related protein [Bacillus cereus]AVR33024.1 putative ESAT-related protein associated Putative toxin component [Bacillus cereus]KIZ28272.1 toxin component [Bacillus cereus]KMP21733.1 toxin component [Bacillus cereus]
MDVKYRPEPWQNMGDGMNRITKDALMKLREANESLKRIDGRIRDLDSDGSIHFNPKDQSQKIGELLDSYTTLQKYCGEAGQLVSEHIDKPFLVEMDKFAQKMRDTSILSFETNNRIGSTTTTVLPGAHAGYGSVPQTIQKKKDKITVEDIFRDSPAFDNVLRAEYKELKKQNPDAKLNYEEYKKVVPSTRGFEYKSIEDEQKKLEMVRDIGIGVGIIITTILCPPLGAAAAVVYGGVQIKSGIDGEDWGTHRKLSQEERVGNIIFGGLDAIPVVGAVGKGVKAFKGTSELADLAKLLKFKEGMPGFNPNLGKNVVQSLKENKNLKNALDAMKNTPIPVAVRTVDTGIGMKLPYIESSTVGEVAGKFSKASTAAKDDAYQLAKGTGNSSKIVNEANLNNIDEFINGTKKFDDVINDYVKLYSEKIISNKTWSWNKSLHGGANLTARQKRMIKEKAVADGLVPDVKVIKADGMRYGFADFKSAGLVVETKQLPERLWLMSDEEQFKWLDNAIGGRPEGMTWHHTEVPGKMELVPFGIHNITIHNGGRSAGMWADAPR